MSAQGLQRLRAVPSRLRGSRRPPPPAPGAPRAPHGGMSFPIVVHVRGMAPSESVEHQVRELAGKLAATGARIQSCEVVLEQPHRHHAQGRRFHVRVSLITPGHVVTVSNDPGDGPAHEDAHVAVRDAFRVARRRLTELAHHHDRGGPEAGSCES
jgi:hypothetical protein